MFTAAIEAGFWWLAVIGLVTSVLSAFYYIRVIKVAFFDEPGEDGGFDASDISLRTVYGASAVFLLIFIAFVGYVIDWAGASAGVFA